MKAQVEAEPFRIYEPEIRGNVRIYERQPFD